MKSTLKKIWLYKNFFFGISLLILGIYVGVNSWDRTLYLSIASQGQGRYVASSEDSSDLVAISLADYQEDVQNKLFGHSQIKKNTENLEFHLGNFLVPSQGKHQFVCQTYSLVELRFVAMGLSLSGDTGEMVVQAPCRMESSEFIGAFVLPMETILKSPEKNTFQLEDEETLIHFYNAATGLTEEWLLIAVRFFNSFDEDGYVVHYKPGQKGGFFELKVKETYPSFFKGTD